LAFGATFYFIKYFIFSTQKLLSEHGFVGRILRFERWFDMCSSDFQIELRHLFFVIFFAWPLFWLIFKQLGYFLHKKSSCFPEHSISQRKYFAFTEKNLQKNWNIRKELAMNKLARTVLCPVTRNH
jgi:hypothetical protein